MRAIAITVLGGLFLLGAAGSCGEEPEFVVPADPSARAEFGKEWFAIYCATCHGVGGRGDGPVADSLVSPPADLTAIASRRAGVFDPDEIAGYIDGRTRVTAHGTSEMPVWGRPVPDRFGRPDVAEPYLSADVIALLVEYLRAIQSEKRV